VDFFQSSHIKTSSYMSPVDLKRIILPVSLKQQQPGIFSTHINLCCLSRLIAEHLNLAEFGHGIFLHSVYSITCTIVVYLGRIKVWFERDVMEGLY